MLNPIDSHTWNKNFPVTLRNTLCEIFEGRCDVTSRYITLHEFSWPECRITHNFTPIMIFNLYNVICLRNKFHYYPLTLIITIA